MQYFRDRNTQELFAFEDDVKVEENVGYRQFFSAEGAPLIGVPTSLDPCDAPTSNPLLDAIVSKRAELAAAYAAAIQKDVFYNGAEFQADEASQQTLNKVLAAANGTLPDGFYWVDVRNARIGMDFQKLQGLSAAMLAQGWSAFQNLQDKKDALRNATNIDEINAITW